MYWKSHCYWGGSGNPTEVCWVDAVIEKKHEEPSRGCDDVLVLDLNAGHLWKEVHTVNYMVKLGIHLFMSFLFSDKTEEPTWVCLLQTPLLLSLLPPSLALAPSTHDSISLWRHSVWKRRVWARNQVFFFFSWSVFYISHLWGGPSRCLNVTFPGITES